MTTPRLLGTDARRATILTGCILLLLAAGWWAGAPAEAREAGTPGTEAWNGRWSEEILDLAATLPLQAGGRVKPLHTWASFTLLGSNHRRSCKDADGNTVSALGWWFDAAFRPERAKSHACFLINTSEILDAIEASEAVRKKMRDRYAYNDLVPDAAARARIANLASKYGAIDSKQRSRVEQGVVNLEMALRAFERMTHAFEFARASFRVGDDPKLREIFGKAERVRFSEILAQAGAMAAAAGESLVSGHAGHAGQGKKEADAVSDLARAAFATTRVGPHFGLFPPSTSAADSPEWLRIRDVAGFALVGGTIEPDHLAMVRAIEGMADQIGRDGPFLEHLKDFHGRARKLAEQRGEYEHIEREVALYELDPFFKCKMLYLIAFILIAITWLRPGWRYLEIGAWGLLWLTLGLHTYGIVQRCIIRERPPISTLYETVIFITGCGVLAMLIIEHINRRKVALALTPIVGFLGLFIAGRYELMKGTDTMPQLPAVLDTNFWLALHVTCISIGYCAGLLAGLIAHVYVLGKVFRFRQGNHAFYANVGKMVYGVLCFALLFSLVGTILGGIWANDSWGRFWGWDPKENGALLICIAQLAILHGRMGGLFKTFGVAQGAILGGVVVAFSWWHVNELGVGLHSYGFTDGVVRGLMIFYGIEAAVMGAGLYAWLRDRPKKVTAPGS